MPNVNHALSFKVQLPQQSVGKVINISANQVFLVESEGRGWQCKQAASCLITPEIGDVVLINGVSDQQVYLLAILELCDPSRIVQLSVPNDLCLSTPNGSIIINSAQQVALNSQSLQIKAKQSDCHIDQLNYVGDEVSVWLKLSRLVGQRCESVWDNITQFSQTMFRKVSKIEQARVGQLDYQAEDFARIHAKNTIITSDAITKLDSEQIHIG